ncbi:DUF1800 domain-containing protein [Mucilaginibacter ginkgonis]|uniref:DUF1800 domain-containing protein n=1 Tax=Mucilaginibacter ginkgonis TaxID=2682091 RepID=A0A6I4HUM4_9SPHI|nr:DUF1800 domain-containing protein [Mucilaginibacter ginkgonis]QQL50383.1 DUF1800 domain-containing protein [Mucilaginibacter ginkgonis]
MKTPFKYILTLCIALISAVTLSSYFNDAHNRYTFKFPYKQAGLTREQAAAHLLSRFTYGPTPGEVQAVAKQGLENWFQQQLDAKLPDDSLNNLLRNYDALQFTNSQVAEQFPKPAQVLRMAVRDSAINKDSLRSDRKEYKDRIQAYMKQNGLRPEQELFRQFINQKILRAAYSNNQLQEVMTSFWFNHFNVSITKNDCAQFIPAYERDVIRPNALGKFGDLLLATAKSPAMLYYLDNFNSSGTPANPARAAAAANAVRQNVIRNLQNNMQDTTRAMAAINKANQARKTQGLNENYAREVMELHTLGVDGGYTQQDVTNAAKVLTGWTIYPIGTYGNAVQNLLSRFTPEQLAARGFVHEGDFMFNPNRHESAEVTVLGKTYGPNGGYPDGVDMLEMLAHKEATAKFISKKLATRFVSDNPPQKLIDKMAKTFLTQDGDIKQVLITMVSSPEFWSAASVREKTKSPMELTIGAVRALNANIKQPYQLFNWINKMGEKMYYYIAPTGFPDRGQYWINTGALLNRMNFGLAIASGRIPGVTVNLAALNQNHEPESAQAALTIYGKMLLPGRDLTQTVKRLTPMLTDPELVNKVSAASNKTTPNTDTNIKPATAMQSGSDAMLAPPKTKDLIYAKAVLTPTSNTMLAQVVGVIIGSPEYQRR